MTQSFSRETQPAWSADGKWIAFVSDRSGRDEVWMAREDGSGLKQLSNSDTEKQNLQWSPDAKALLYAACDRLGLAYWKSAANFVLVCAGDRTEALVAGAGARGVYIRDRSTEPGCAGCIRIGAGIVEHTRRCITVMEEVLCAAP